jgi:hypothetical protein
MFLAHLRGLLKPGYPYGVRSFQAETMMLDQLDRDLAVAEHQDVVTQLGIQATTGTLNPNLLSGLLPSLLVRMSMLREGVTPRPADTTGGDIDALTRIYYALEEAGFLGEPMKDASNAKE